MAPKATEEPLESDDIGGCDGEDGEAPELPETAALLSPATPSTGDSPTWPPPSPPAPLARPMARRGSFPNLETPDPEPAASGSSSFFSSKKIIRWVGVHGGQASEAPGSSNVPASPNTPHIVVSTENETSTAAKTPADKPPTDTPAQVNTSGSNGQVLNGQSLPSPPPTPANNTEEKKLRPDKLSLNMIAMDLPECLHTSLDLNMYRKSRRNSMNEMYKRIGGSQTNLQQTLAANTIRRSSSRNSLMPSVLDWKQEGNDSLIACLSALYGKLLVVMGMAFPIAEVISHDIPISFYNGFYLYLYIGSIMFLVYAYVFLLRSLNLPTEHLKSKFQSLRSYMAMPDLNTVFPRRNTAQQEGPGTRKDLNHIVKRLENCLSCN